MTFDNYYPNRKDWRRAYHRKCQQFDRACRPGGDCDWCRGNRQHKHRKREQGSEDMISLAETLQDSKSDNRPVIMPPSPTAGLLKALDGHLADVQGDYGASKKQAEEDDDDRQIGYYDGALAAVREMRRLLKTLQVSLG